VPLKPCDGVHINAVSSTMMVQINGTPWLMVRIITNINTRERARGTAALASSPFGRFRFTPYVYGTNPTLSMSATSTMDKSLRVSASNDGSKPDNSTSAHRDKQANKNRK
jgi:hypothetical protein